MKKVISFANVALNLISAYIFVNGYAWVKSSGSESYSLIDTSGKIICTSTAIEIHDMSNDACYVKEKAASSILKIPVLK